MDNDITELADAALIALYLFLRDKYDEKKREFSKRHAPMLAKMEEIQVEMLKRMQDDGIEAIRANTGTVYKNPKTSVTVKDWQAALNFIVKEENWHFLDHKVNKTAVISYMEENNETPPGVNVSTEFRAQFRVK